MSLSFSPLVSVVMAVFKPHPVYFPQAVESVLGQTHRDLEFVIVEDPSTHPAGDLLIRYQDSRIRHIRNRERTSLLEQRNQGLIEARSDLVAVLDADDIWVPERLEKQVGYLEAHPEVAVLGSQIQIIDDNGRICGGRVFPLTHEAIMRALRRFNPICHSSVLFRKGVVLGAGGYQLKKPIGVEDYELWCRLAHSGVQFATHPESLVRYRLHSRQLKVTALRDLVQGTINIKEMHWRSRRDIGDWLCVWMERMLLYLPPRLVLELLAKFYYHGSFAESGETAIPQQAYASTLMANPAVRSDRGPPLRQVDKSL